MPRQPAFSYLFFVRRQPKLRGISQDWERPPHIQDYNNLLNQEGFLSNDAIKNGSQEDISVVQQDMLDLDTYLLPTFFEFSQRANYYQNMFYSLHWILLLGTFLTLTFGLFALYGLFEELRLAGRLVYPWFGLCAMLSGIATINSVMMSGQGEPQKQWAGNRRIAEELRSHYFRYLAHISPYSQTDRLSVLSTSIENIISKERGRTQSILTNEIQQVKVTRPKHNEQDIAFLTDFYLRTRVQGQLGFYKSRMKEGRINTAFIANTGFVLLMLATLMAAISIVKGLPFLLLWVTLLPAIILLSTNFRWLYGWERQITIYRDTQSGLEQVLTTISGLESLPNSEKKVILNRIVTATEEVMNNEVNQWGIFQGGLTRYHREGFLEVEPMFGTPPNESQYQCDGFMIMPFAEKYSAIYRDHIKPVVQHEMQLNLKRGDDFFTEHAIMRDVWGAIYTAKFVIAECTERNANVYYELGIAHTLGKPAIMITQDIETIPFDLRHLRIIVYQDTLEGLTALKGQLQNAIRALI